MTPRAHSDDGLARAVRPACRPRTRHPGHAELDLEAVVLEDARQVPLGLELLHAQLTEAELHVDNLLDLLRAVLDHLERLFLERLQPGISLRG